MNLDNKLVGWSFVVHGKNNAINGYTTTTSNVLDTIRKKWNNTNTGIIIDKIVLTPVFK